MSQLEPYPSRDALVAKDLRASQEFDRWLSEVLSVAVQNAPARVESVTGSVSAPLNAGVGITPLGSTQIAGRYRLGCYVQILTQDPVSYSVQVTITWTFNGSVRTAVFSALTLATAISQSDGIPLFHVDPGSPVSYTVTYASNTPNLCTYVLDLVLELIQAD